MKRAISLVFTILVACSSGGSSGGSANPVAEGDYCARFAEEVCKVIVPCCAEIGSPATDANCRTAYQGTCQSDRDRAKSSGLTYDSQAAGNCVAAIPSYVVDCKSRPKTDPISIALNAACDNVYVGSVPDGGACMTSTQCVHPPDSAVSCDAGKCVVRAFPKVGESCGGSLLPCEANAVCDTGTKKCAALPAAGPCTALGQCASGSYCDAARVCQPKKPVGSPCASSAECAAICTAGACALQPIANDAQCKDIASGKV